jgi:hypothetical protein
LPCSTMCLVMNRCIGKFQDFLKPALSKFAVIKSRLIPSNFGQTSSITEDVLQRRVRGPASFSRSSQRWHKRVDMLCPLVRATIVEFFWPECYPKRDFSVASMGASDSTGPRIALQLAQSVGSHFERIEINATDYIDDADNILKITSGERVFWHWHTGIFARKVGFDPTATVIMGSNGEFARSY